MPRDRFIRSVFFSEPVRIGRDRRWLQSAV
jgi:hypothetical protein